MNLLNVVCGQVGHAGIRATPSKIVKNVTRYLTTTSMDIPQQQNPLFLRRQTRSGY